MNRLKHTLAASLALLLAVPAAQAQLSTIMVVDFERAVVESAEGKKASEKFNATMQAKQTEIEKKQKELDEQQRKLQNGARTLSDTAKADLQRDIDRRTRDLQRLDEDAQKDLQALRDDLLRPIAERASLILQALSAERGYTVVVDTSDQDSNVIWFNPKNDITAELTNRINAAAAATPANTGTGTSKPPAATAAPTTPKPTPVAPTPTIPKPSPPKP